ncbi:MAG: DUF4430 domain-containing protein [Anaeroplasmataceae bacterium]
MRKIKNLFLCFLFAFLLVSAAGCSADNKIKELEDKISALEKDNEDKDTKISELEIENDSLQDELESVKNELNILKGGSYSIKVYDIDDELLGEKNLYVKQYEGLFEALDANFEVEATNTNYGHYITSINNSIVDNNYYVAIYENGVLSNVGIDEITVDKGDLFEFKVECWNTELDEYDILLDKIIYHYSKTTLKTTLASSNSYTDSTYWQNMAVYMMLNAKDNNNNLLYSQDLYTIDYSSNYKNSVLNQDVSSFSSAANYAKYYYASRLLNNDLTSFKDYYKAYLEGVNTYNSEYVLPFTLSIADQLGLSEYISDSVKNTTYRASTAWGTDGLAWQLTGLALYTELNETELNPFTFEALDSAYSPDVSAALYILPYAAMNIDVRTLKNTNNVDLIAYLLDNYYDKSTKQFTTEKLGSGDYSSNQIYASLMTYKVMRDTGKRVILFA